MKYDYSAIEARWKEQWIESDLYKVEIDQSKPKFYVLDMFPYPSGAGLHVGHPLGYIASDIYSRYKRQKGFNVLHPMGFDAFGLPAEEYAIATGVHPADSTEKNIERYKQQLGNIGFSFDWSREVRTCEPEYYKWTQWIFTLLYSHYYDTKANKAMSISELITEFEEKGNKECTAFTSYKENFSAKQWAAYSEKEKSDILSSYRLAYRKIGYVNWCEALGTVLANDQIKDGLSERGGHPVERKAMTQWYLRTTAYADRLLYGLDNIEWSTSLKTIQENWIGRSKGAAVHFSVEGHEHNIEIYTTRPDTIYGATFMVLAPEHPLVKDIMTSDQSDQVKNYQSLSKQKSERERQSNVKEVTGAFTGAYATNPFTKKKMPIWISDYVLMDYGTGAIMAVPSDDERDNAFAEKFGLEIVQVVDKSDYPNAGMHDKVGKIINSELINGLEVKEAISKMCTEIESRGLGQIKVNYKMRDANFSRQRYWGEPFPIVFNEEDIPDSIALDQLPVQLPKTDDFKPTSDGQSPLSRIADWVDTEAGTRETDTMPAVAGSSWYFLRYMDPHNSEQFASEESLKYWESVDLYVGGSEHAVAHLLYARFWHKFLYDLGYVYSKEPFKKLINQGMIQGVIESLPLEKNSDDTLTFVSYDKIEEGKEYAYIPTHIDYVSDYGSNDSYLSADGMSKFLDWRPDYKNAKIIGSDGSAYNGSGDFKFVTKSEVGKMSKRYYNVVNPDDVVAEYGADTFRLYEMFLGPIEQSKPWDTKGIEGVSKFIRKFWGLFFEGDNFSVSEEEPTKEEYKILHQTIKKVDGDIERFSFNTAISSFMICVNELKKLKCNKRKILEPLITLLAPFAPFTTEELWQLMGNNESVHLSDYPISDEQYLVEDSIEYPVCINGKKKTLKSFPADASKDDIEAEIRSSEELSKWTNDKNILKIIIVPKRMINIVVK